MALTTDIKNPALYLSDFRDSAQFLMLYSEYEADYRPNHTYTMVEHNKRLHLIGHSSDHKQLLDIDWLDCFWNNNTTWLEVFPVDRLTDEELFAIKLGGPEMVFGPRGFWKGGKANFND